MANHIGSGSIKAALIKDVADWAKAPDNRYYIRPSLEISGCLEIARTKDMKTVFRTGTVIFLNEIARAGDYFTWSYMYDCFVDNVSM